MSSCCPPDDTGKPDSTTQPPARDWLLISTASLVALLYVAHVLFAGALPFSALETASHTVFEMLNTLWWGLLLAAFFVGILDHIPQSWVDHVLGEGGTTQGVLRATGAGVLLDLCSHGILMVGMKLYQRGASLGQVMAFLIASPWNSLSLTIILFALVGVGWTLLFIVASMLVGIVTGIIVDRLVAVGKLPDHRPPPCPHQQARLREQRAGFSLRQAVKQQLAEVDWRPGLLPGLMWQGLKDSKMVLRWVFLGILLAGLIRVLFDESAFQSWFGADTLGLLMTILLASAIEVCSEGSTPIAADIFNRAGAPGNAFAFLMTGVATDYTEILSIRDTVKSWAAALVLPLLCLPQIVVLALIMNNMA